MVDASFSMTKANSVLRSVLLQSCDT